MTVSGLRITAGGMSHLASCYQFNGGVMVGVVGEVMAWIIAGVMAGVMSLLTGGSATSGVSDVSH